MKILRLTAENVKKLRAVEIVPEGNIVQVTGPNGSGKSSVLDAIFYALAGTKDIPSQPVRKGEQRAIVRLDLGEITVTRKFARNGGTTLTVEAENGARFPSPQRMLDELLGTLTFDPLAFSRMEPRKQLEQLRGLVKVEADIDALDAANVKDYETRTERNKAAKALRVQAEAILFDPNAPAEPVDTDQLLAEMQAAGEQNTAIESARLRRAAQVEGVEALKRGLTKFEARIAELERDIEQQRAMIASDNERMQTLQAEIDTADPIPERIDVTAIRARIDAAKATNAAVANRQRRSQLNKDAERIEDAAHALTNAMEKRTAEKQQAIAAAVMPIPGLSFGDGEVIYNGVPFDQASSAEQLRVSVAIAMAANPKLRVLRIKDGSLLDENGLRMVSEMATAGDYQIWIEQVDTTGKVGIVMEDGAVRDVASKEAA